NPRRSPWVVESEFATIGIEPRRTVFCRGGQLEIAVSHPAKLHPQSREKHTALVPLESCLADETVGQTAAKPGICPGGLQTPGLDCSPQTTLPTEVKRVISRRSSLL